MNPSPAFEQVTSPAPQWEDLTQKANLAYKDLYEAVQRNMGLLKIIKKNPLPSDSSAFLGSCVWRNIREELESKLQSFNDRSEIPQLAERYLSLVAQILSLAAETVGGKSWRGYLAQQSEHPGAAASPAVNGASEAAKSPPPADSPVPAPTPVTHKQPKSSVVAQQFEQSSRDVIQEIGQAQAVLAAAQQQIIALSQQTGRALSLMTTLQERDEVANKLQVSEDRRRKMSESVRAKLVGIITGFEQQYLGPVTYAPSGESESRTVGAQFQSSIRTIITQIEQVLSSEFGLFRLQVSPGNAPEPQTTTWNERSRIAAPSHELVDKVAYVTTPGYYLKRADGRIDIYQPTQVVLYGKPQ